MVPQRRRDFQTALPARGGLHFFFLVSVAAAEAVLRGGVRLVPGGGGRVGAAGGGGLAGGAAAAGVRGRIHPSRHPRGRAAHPGEEGPEGPGGGEGGAHQEDPAGNPQAEASARGRRCGGENVRVDGSVMRTGMHGVVRVNRFNCFCDATEKMCQMVS